MVEVDESAEGTVSGETFAPPCVTCMCGRYERGYHKENVDVKKAEVDEEARGERGELTKGKMQQEKEERRKR